MSLTKGRVEAFQNDPFQIGLDLNRSVLGGSSHGNWDVDPAATIRQGDLVSRDSQGRLILSTGPNTMGFAKWNKATSLLAAVVDEPVVLTGTTAKNLKRANVSNVRVQSTTGGSGTKYVSGTDYTLAATNGTVARIGAGAIADGATVYVSYTWAVTEADLDFQGRNFFNLLDDVTIAAGKMTVIQGHSLIYTTRYDTSQVYAVNEDILSGSGGAAGLATNQAGGELLGTCFQKPSASDPFLGVEFRGFTTT